jgi:hypothetical protein
MSSSKKQDLYSDLVAGVHLSEAQNPYFPLTHCALHAYVYAVYTYLFTQGRERWRRGGGREG